MCPFPPPDSYETTSGQIIVEDKNRHITLLLALPSFLVTPAWKHIVAFHCRLALVASLVCDSFLGMNLTERERGAVA